MQGDYLVKMVTKKEVMKKKKDLFVPSPLEQGIQEDFMSIISSTPSRKKVEELMPKIKEIETRMKARKDKVELRRLMKE